MTGPGAASEIPAGTLMQGKRGLIMGVANNRSIAWGIAKAAAAQGASLAFTYQGDALKKRVEPLAAELGSKLVLPCDVTDAASVDAVFAELGRQWGKLDFLVHAIAFSDKAELDGRYVDTTEKNFTQTMLISCYLLHGAGAARREADERRRLAADAHLLRRREGHAALQRHGRGEGGARGERALPRRRPRAQRHPRQRHLGGADQDAGRLRHRRLPLHPEVERVQLGAAPHGDHRGGGRGRRSTCCPTSSRGVTGEVHHVDAGYHVQGMKNEDAPDISVVKDAG